MIGPVLVYSTYLGGSLDQGASAIAVDAAGSAYVTGLTLSPDFPTTRRAFDTTCGTDGACNPDKSHFPGASFKTDVFVTKLNAAGSALVYSTYLGNQDERDLGIAVDAAGHAYVTGAILSPNFPIKHVLQPAGPSTKGEFPSAFVTTFNPTGSDILFSTYLGGTDGESGNDIAIDHATNIYVTGTTSSPDFPTTEGAFQTDLPSPSGAFVGFVVKIGDE